MIMKHHRLVLPVALFVSKYCTTTTSSLAVVYAASHRRYGIDDSRMTTEQGRLPPDILYEPFRKHPILFQDHFEMSWLHSDIKELLKHAYRIADVMPHTKDDRTGTTDDDDMEYDDDTIWSRKLLESSSSSHLIREEAPQVYSFHCFHETFIRLFNEEIDNFYLISERHNIPIRRPNSMNDYGVILNEIGMKPIISSFQQQYLYPITKLLFPKQSYPRIDDHYSFLVRYQANEDVGLDMHTDDSDVTFNVCMGHDFTGATLTFCGMFGARDHRKFVTTYHHEIGRAVLHLGNQRHGADDIESGIRTNLIIWNRNGVYRSSPEYQLRRSPLLYETEDGPPDTVCVSYTHDRDAWAYKSTDPAKKKKQQNPNAWCPPRGKEYDGFPGDRPNDITTFPMR